MSSNIHGLNASLLTLALSATTFTLANFDDDDAWIVACLESAIQPVYTTGIDNIPTNLLQFLPPPESTDFPLLCSNLFLLFDQAPSHVIDIPDRP